MDPRRSRSIPRIHRGHNIYGDALIDRYFLARMKAKRDWVLWVCYVDHSDYEGRVIRIPLKWCLAKGLEGKAAASAMLQATWQGDEWFNDWEHVDKRTIVEKAGLLSTEEIAEILHRALAAKAVAAAAQGAKDPYTTSATVLNPTKGR